MKSDAPWWTWFTFMRDGISGSELLGLTLVLGMVLLLAIVQIKETGSSKRLDFAWLFLDQQSGKVSRSGVMAFGGFLLGCWVVVDAEQSGHLDWSFLGIFLSYCAGVRALEVWKPKDEQREPGSTVEQTTVRKETLTVPARPDDPDAPAPVAKPKAKR